MIKSNGMVTSTSLPSWKRSSRCTPSGNCTEVLLDEEIVGVRDSKNASVGSLAFARPQWATFLMMIAS